MSRRSKTARLYCGGHVMNKVQRSNASFLGKFFYRGVWTVLWLIPIFVVFFLLFLMYVQRVEITSIVIKGDIKLTAKEIKSYINIDIPTAYLKINTVEISKKLRQHPLIYSARVKKKFDGTLVLLLTRSIPLVTMLATINGIATPVYFDKDGKCVQVGTKGGIVDVPIVSGLKLIDPRVGVYLPAWAQEVLASLATIKKEHSALFHSVSEFKIHSHGDNYKTLEIWFADFKQKYIADIGINVKHLQKIWYFAEKISKETFAQDFESFDVRQGVIIAKKKRMI